MLLARTGKKLEDLPRGGKVSKLFRRDGVPFTDEITRVLALPIVEWEGQGEWADELNQLCQKPGGKQTLWPTQVAVLQYLLEYRGCFAQIRAGEGKTICSYLAATVTDAKRPLLLVPAHLKLKTQREFKVLAKHWNGTDDMPIVSFQLLGRSTGADILNDRKPDLIIVDEAHYLKNRGAAVTRRFERYMYDNPETVCLIMSGTMSKRSLFDYHHLLMWCIGDRDFPMPFKEALLKDWAYALDEKVKPELRMDVGALSAFVELLTEEEKHFTEEEKRSPSEATLALVRRGYGKRLATTGGVVSSRGTMVDASLEIATYAPLRPDNIDEAIGRLYKYWEPPKGEDCVEPVDVWRHARELACGFVYHWTEPGPEEWLLWRRRWGALVRTVIAAEMPEFDSPFQIGIALKNGHLGSLGELDSMGGLGEKINELYGEWRGIRDTFKPKTQAHWISDYMCDAVKMMVNCAKDPMLIWVEHVAMGKRLSEVLDAPFFHNKGFAKDKTFVDDYRGPCAILSIGSNSSGRNLQHWRNNFFVTPMPQGDVWEQAIARTHRPGQLADMVGNMIFFGCRENVQDFEQARADCLYTRDTQLQTKKLGLATYLDDNYKRVRPIRWDDGIDIDGERDIGRGLDPWVESIKNQLNQRIGKRN